MTNKAETEYEELANNLLRANFINWSEGMAKGAVAIRALLSQNARLREALKPFAKIKPSSLYPDDGSEAEDYVVTLKASYGNPAEFTGADLALARAALNGDPEQ